MLQRKWVGLFVRGEEVKPLTIWGDIGKEKSFYDTIDRYVNAYTSKGWTLLIKTEEITLEVRDG